MENKKNNIPNNNIDILENLELRSLDSPLEGIKEDNFLEIENEKLEIVDESEVLESHCEIDSESLETQRFDVEKEVNSNLIEEKNSKFKKILSYIIFSFKYVLSSTLIFAVLLVTMNYSAYYNIAKSYVFQEDFKKNTESLIASVNASYIKEKVRNKDKQEKKISIIETEEDRKQWNNNHSINKLIKEVNKDDINLNIEMVPYENRIVIPKIGKNIPLIDVKKKTVSGEKELNNIFMKELEKGVVRYPSSAKPGKIGNSFIFGHSSNFPWMEGNYNDVFSLLDNVEFDDEIIVYYGQKKYIYRIREKKIIKPGDVGILKRDKSKSEITLMTCWPICPTLNRLIVTGELIVVEKINN